MLFIKEPSYFFKITLAGKNIIVKCRGKKGFTACKDYLAEFSQEDFSVYVSESILEENYSRLVKFSDDKISNEIIELESVLISQEIARNMLSYNTFLMHGSVVALDNKAYMFSASSGVGKTTRTRLWLSMYPGSLVVNGDKPLIKITDSQAIACGTPWCGKEGWNTNTMVPLRAIFLLERADEREKSSIEEISLGKAIPFLLQQTYCPEEPELMRKTLALLKSLEGKVKIYRFCSTQTEDSIRLAYETAKS